MTTYVYLLYGLGGSLFSYGMESVLGAHVRALPDIVCPPAFQFWSWDDAVLPKIKEQPEGSKTVVCGHSMGAATATYITDHTYVDLLVLYDLAGLRPSRIGANTGRCIDIYDTIPDIVPEWRVEANEGYEDRIERWYSRHGHTGQDDSQDLMKQVVAEIKKLNIKE